jgi:hypothetical protein
VDIPDMPNGDIGAIDFSGKRPGFVIVGQRGPLKYLHFLPGVEAPCDPLTAKMSAWSGAGTASRRSGFAGREATLPNLVRKSQWTTYCSSAHTTSRQHRFGRAACCTGSHPEFDKDLAAIKPIIARGGERRDLLRRDYVPRPR